MAERSGPALPAPTVRQEAARRLPALQSGRHDPGERTAAAPSTGELVARANAGYWTLHRKAGDDKAALAALRNVRDAINHLIDLHNEHEG